MKRSLTSAVIASLWGAVPAAVLLIAVPAGAGTICHGVGITGFEAQARHAAAALGPVTSAPSRLLVYVEKVGRIYYYQSNYVAPGTPFPAKIVSDEAMPLRTVVENLIYRSREEADLHAQATRDTLANRRLVYADASVYDGKALPVELAAAAAVRVDRPVEYAALDR